MLFRSQGAAQLDKLGRNGYGMSQQNVDLAGTGRTALGLSSRAAAAAELRLEAEELDALGVVHLVHLRQLRGKVLLGDIRQARVDDVEHELLAPQQGVLLEP